MKNYVKYGILFLVGIIMFYISTSLFKGTSATPANSDFKDDIFYKCVIDYYNIAHADNEALSNSAVISDEQLQSIKILKCNNYTKDDHILDVTGLDLLTNLEELYLAGNGLTSLDVSNNKKLKILDVEANSLEIIDVSENTLLEELDVSNNNISSVSLGDNTELVKLDLSENNLSGSINLEANKKLNELYLGGNGLESLVVSNNKELKILDVEANSLTSIDVSKNTLLEELDASNNEINNISGTEYTKLKELDASNNNISLCSSAAKKLSSLLTLNISLNEVTECDTSVYENLETLIANDNLMTKVILTKSIKYVQLSDNQLSSVNISGLNYLTDLYLENNKLTSVDVSANRFLKYLNVRKNDLNNLNVSKNTLLESLLVDYNNLKSLNINSNNELKNLYAEGNQITELNTFNNSSLRVLDISDNNLSSIDLSSNNSLMMLNINENEFKENIYVYNGNEHNIGTNIKLPQSLGWGVPVWSFDDTSGIATIVNNTKVSGQSVGSIEFNGELAGKYINNSNVNVVEIRSTKYMIDGSSINVGNDRDVNTIRSNIQYDSNLNLDINIEKSTLDVKYGNETLKTFSLVMGCSINLSDYTIINGNIFVNVGTTVDTFDVSSSQCFSFYDSSNQVVKSGVLKTGYKISDGINSYVLIVKGDSNGDGNVTTADVSMIFNAYRNGNVDMNNIYMIAGDVVNDSRLRLADVAKLYQYIRKAISTLN